MTDPSTPTSFSGAEGTSQVRSAPENVSHTFSGAEGTSQVSSAPENVRAERPYMPDYGVDTPDWQPLPWSWAAERLTAARNLWVVTVSASGRPHALPVWGVWDEDDRRFGFSCGPRSRKIRNLDANPAAVVMTESTVECVSVEGRAARVSDPGRQGRWVERYLAKYRSLAPDLTADFVGQNVLVELTPERAFAVIETEEEFSTRATRWVFDG